MNKADILKDYYRNIHWYCKIPYSLDILFFFIGAHLYYNQDPHCHYFIFYLEHFYENKEDNLFT